MEMPELPECPVCLTSYDAEYTIPRVLPCGHTACESCLKNLPQKYPQTIRCPACNQLVKFLSKQGPSSLPKNIDLLRLTTSSTTTTTIPKIPPTKPQNYHQDTNFVASRLWPDGFYDEWKKWVLPNNTVLVDGEEKRQGLFVEGGVKVRLFEVNLNGLLDFGKIVNGLVFKVSYVVRVLSFLNNLKEKEREEVGLVLKVCKRKNRICEVFGFWGDLEGGNLYLVCKRSENGSVLDNLGRFENGFSEDGLHGFGMIGMETCEAVIGLRSGGLIAGCFGFPCFELDGFGHVNLSLGEVMVLGRLVREGVVEAGCGGRRLGSREMGVLVCELLKKMVFVSPEVLFEILKKEGIEVECCDCGYSVGYESDVWSLAHFLLRLLIGKQFIEVLVDYVEHAISMLSEEDGLEFSCLYIGMPEKVSVLLKSKFGDEFESVQGILSRCLNFDPGSRPLVIDVWKCSRELITTLQFDTMPRLDAPSTHEEDKGHCLVIGELCRVPKEKSAPLKKDGLQKAENRGGEDMNQVEVNADKDFVEGLVKANVKFQDMQGHCDCITGLAIGGGFLFSSSFDKSVHLWSLQDFSHIHTFKGHEHKVMAVIYVDEEEPLCISGDSGGGIFLWSISIPLGQEPLKKWYEPADWRYSGIHALNTAGNGCLYTGSGDRSIKAWSLKDGTLLCTMDGHRSVVSTLAACDGVLYSGSWDGTIRLWSLSDHSLLTVLGEDVPGNVTSVLALVVDENMLVAAHENGHIKVWQNDVFMKSIKLHDGAIFAIEKEGRCLFTGGWDKTVNVEELTGDEIQVDISPVGSIPGGSVITALLFWQGKLFVGYGDGNIKVFYYGK